jgi:peptide deformylase
MNYTGRVRTLVDKDEPRLHKPSAKVSREEVKNDPLFKQLVLDMIATMAHYKGVGIAASQIGVYKRVFVIATTPTISVVVNPVITARVLTDEQIAEGKLITITGPESEGCLSLPDETYDVARLELITLTGLTPTGRGFRLDLDGYLARVSQHETDHLNGILICDRAAQQAIVA